VSTGAIGSRKVRLPAGRIATTPAAGLGVTPDRVCAGQVALVTGASQGGTGTAIAIRLAAEGAAVAITARNREGLEETQRRIEATGGTCIVLPADLSDPDGGRSELVPRTEETLGPIDILVNNAAANGYHPFEEVTVRALERCLQVNLWTPWELMQAVVPGMRERGHGWVLNLTSFSAELPPGPPFPRNLPATGGFQYGASKAALNRLTVTAASECFGQGIAVNALTPQAAIATPSLVAAGWIDEALFEPLETMAEAALVLCSGDPAILTGRIAFSLQLLVELRRSVRDLEGDLMVEGWQPDDIPAVIARQEANLLRQGWPDAYSFGRVHSPRP
jgi:NAD(P)-dependent dehydrogenase (short-subunit alcohol dehydrogenase family)